MLYNSKNVIRMKIISTLLLLLLTLNIFGQRPYDNGPIIIDNTRYTLGNSKWNKYNLTYYIYNSSNHLTYSERETAIQNAFQTWSSCSRFSFTQLTSPENADITIKWAAGDHGDGHPFDGVGGSSNVLAHASYPAPDGGSYSCQLHFDDAEDWSVDGSGIDLETIALHEIGHILGIAHSDVFGSIMYPTYYGIKRTLTDDDCQAIWDLYGYPFHIVGPSHVCGSPVFSVAKLPSGADVTWNFSFTSSSSILQTNVPATNQCTIYNPGNYYINDSIVATISKNGQQLAILKKYVYAYFPFYGTYSQTLRPINKYGYYAIPETNFTDDDNIIVNPDCYIFIESSKFKNMTMSCIPHNYSTASINRIDEETIRLYVNYEPRIRYGSVTIYGSSPEGCDDFSFTVYVTANRDLIIPLQRIYSDVSNGQLLVYINTDNDVYLEDQKDSYYDLSGWLISIIECTSGQCVYSNEFQNERLRIDTSKWKKGVYLIQAQNGKQIINKKIVLK